MEELVKYFEALEARIAALEEAQQTNEAVIASMEAELEELKNLPAPEPQVVEKIVEVPVEKIVEVEKVVEKPVEVIKEVIVEKPVVAPTPQPEIPVAEPEIPEVPAAPASAPEPEPQPAPMPEPMPTTEAAPATEASASKAAIYGKPVDDIRLAISLGDRFLYQRELFGQNAELMQRTLTELNELNSLDEAIGYISRFGWDTESNSYQQFLVALHRRFG